MEHCIGFLRSRHELCGMRKLGTCATRKNSGVQSTYRGKNSPVYRRQYKTKASLTTFFTNKISVEGALQHVSDLFIDILKCLNAARSQPTHPVPTLGSREVVLCDISQKLLLYAHHIT